jgi:ERF superfamily
VSAPSVYCAINAIAADLAKSGIAKTHINQTDDYKYRSIDDVLDTLAPLLAVHRLCVLPNVLERTVTERRDDGDRLLLNVAVKVAYTLTSAEDGSSHAVEAYGEALDGGDKATAKAMSAAFKSAIVQTFCIPICGAEDPDRTDHRLSAKLHEAEPVQGWEQWCEDLKDILSVCESEQAIAMVQERNRKLLKSLSRERPHLYHEIGSAFAEARERLSKGPLREPKRAARTKPRGKARQVVDA